MGGIPGLLTDIAYRLFGSTKLRPYEQACFDAWRGKLSPDAMVVLDRQLARYDFVQRGAAGKGVYFFCTGDPRCSRWPVDVRFPLQLNAQVAAGQVTVRYTGSARRRTLRADMLTAYGRFFAIVFDRPPANVLPKHVQREQIEVVKAEVLVDLMAPDRYATEPMPDSSSLQGWVRDWAERWGARTLRRPLPPDAREEILPRLDTALPADYLELTSQTEGLTAGACEIYGLSRIETIVLPEANLLVLAYIERRGALGVIQGSADGHLHFYGNDNDELEAAGAVLTAAIEKQLALVDGAGGTVA